MNSAPIVLDRLVKRYGDLIAVDGISLEVPKGEVLGFLGPNGAGKSTTMRMAAGFLAPDSGTATICGHDVVAAQKEAKRRLGYMPEGAPSYGEMTPEGFLAFVAEVRGLAGADRRRSIEAAIARTDLGQVARQTIDTLSKGYKRRVGLASAILHDPPVLILDEPTDGLDPNQKHHVRGLIRDMAPDKAIVVSTHILEEVDAVCTRAIIIDRGRIVADGTAETLRRRLPAHNAVVIRLPSAAADKALQALSRVEAVAGVETLGKHDGRVRLRALARNGRSIAGDVAAAFKAEAIAAEDIAIEEGRLDEVFRQITTSDAGGGHAS